ncbi:helix-turn-helix domain-containing protein [Actinosynnema sp. NPDC002837]
MPRAERPLDPDGGPLTAFAAALRALRQEAGGSTYRELARRTGYSTTTLSDAASGRALPSLAVTLAYVRVCDGDVEEWQRRWHELAANQAAVEAVTPNVAETAVDDDGPAPYFGLSAFGPEDGDWFFGRERLTDDLATRVANRRFLAVFGASGVGKSSLLRAGLLPRLSSGGGHVLLLTPGMHPMDAIATGLASLLGIPSDEVLADLRAGRRGLNEIATRALQDTSPSADLIIVVDQFEEVFTLCSDQDERDTFITTLTYAACSQDSRVRVVLGIRADFLAHCSVHGALVEAMRDAQFTVGPMTVEELRRAITHPANRAQCAVESSLLTHLVSHTHSRAGALPLLSHALRETWRRRKGNTLTLAGFHATGGIQGALSTTAEALYADLDDAGRRLARDLFTRLTALGDGHEDTKRRVTITELDAGPELDVLLDRFARARLITLDHDTVEFSHEILVNAWPRLRTWLDDDRDALRLHHALSEAARQWEELDNDPGALYRGARLTAAQEWATSGNRVLTRAESSFLDASTAAERHLVRAARRRTRRLRQFVALLSTLLLLTATALVYAVRAQRTATEQRNIALVHKALVDAEAIRDSDPALSLQLTLAAHRLAPIPESRNALFGAFTKPVEARVAAAGVAATATGDLLASIRPESDGTIELWDVSDPAHVTKTASLPKPDHPENRLDGMGPRTVEFSPDGRTLAASGSTGLVYLWDVTDPRKPTLAVVVNTLVVVGTSPVARSVAFDSTSRLLAVNHGWSSDLEATVSLWDLSRLDTPVPVGSVQVPRRSQLEPLIEVVDVEFAMSTDRKVVLVTGGGHDLHLWDVAEPRQPVELKDWRVEDKITAVAFSPDGRALATATDSARTLQLTDIGPDAEFQLRATTTGHTGTIEAIAFSPDGQTLATAGADKTVRLVDLSDPDHPQDAFTFDGHTDTITELAFARSGDALVSGSSDNTARLVDLVGTPTSGHRVQARSIASGGDGKTVRTVVELVNGSIEVFVGKPHRRMHRVSKLGPVGTGQQVTLSPDGKLLGVVTDDLEENAEIWDITSRPELAFRGFSTLIGFSSDNKYVVTYGGPDSRLEIRERGSFRVVGRDVTPRQDFTLGPGRRVILDNSLRRIVLLDSYGIDVFSLDYSVENPKVAQLALVPPFTTSSSFGRGKPVGTFDGRGNLITVDGTDSAHIWPIGDEYEQLEPADAIKLGSLVAAAVAVDEGTQRVLVGGEDGTLQLWNAENLRAPVEVAAFRAHDGTINDIAFTPDRRGAVTVGNDYTIRFWDLDLDSIADRICRLAHPRLTAQDWDVHFPGVPFDAPCPG